MWPILRGTALGEQHTEVSLCCRAAQWSTSTWLKWVQVCVRLDQTGSRTRPWSRNTSSYWSAWRYTWPRGPASQSLCCESHKSELWSKSHERSQLERGPVNNTSPPSHEYDPMSLFYKLVGCKSKVPLPYPTQWLDSCLPSHSNIVSYNY